MAKQNLDAEEVIKALTQLIAEAHSPIVQECLRGARAEIAILTATDGEGEPDVEAYEDDARYQETGEATLASEAA
jgi:hypothetical protein